MEGISDKAIKTNYAENKYRYNSGTELQNKEFSDGTGLQMYETGYRMLDPQLGRFSQVDPLSDQGSSESPYAFVGNNPVSFADPTGLKVAPKGGFSHYSPADQYYLNCLADPMHHVYPGDGDFMDGSSGGGGFDESGNSDADSYSISADCFFATGNVAQQVFSAFVNASNNPDADGDWSFTIGSNKNGDLGYWQSYGFTSSAPTVTDGMIQLAGAGVGQRFVSLGDEGNTFSSYSGSNGSGVGESNGWGHSPVEDVGFLNDGVEGAARGLYYTKNIGYGVTKWSGKLGLAINVLQIGMAFHKDGNQFGENTRKAVDETAGAMIGAEAGADAGMLLGAEVGVWFFGWGAAPGALIGGFVGGVVGSIWGSDRGDDVYKDATQ